MLPIAAAFANPHAGPSWTSSTPSISIVSAFRTIIIVSLFPGSGKWRCEGRRDSKEEKCMGIYNRFILQHVIELAMRQKNFAPFRERVVGATRGRVLEIGIGSGLNLPSYRQCAEEVYGVDPSTELLAKTSHRLNTARIPVKLVKGSGEKLPFEDRTFDAVVMTLTHQTLPSPCARCVEC